MSASSHCRLLVGRISEYRLLFSAIFDKKQSHGLSEYLSCKRTIHTGSYVVCLDRLRIEKNPITRVKVLNRIFESTVSVKSIMLVIHVVINMEIKTFHRVSTESIMLIHSMGRYGGKKPQPIKQKSAPWCALVVSMNFDF